MHLDLLQRLDQLEAAFAGVFGQRPTGVWAAPGRVNLIGEHTDYNDGFVLPMALAQRVYVAGAAAVGSRSRIGSLQQDGAVVAFQAAHLSPGDVQGWAAYGAGVCWAFRAEGHDIAEVDLLIDSELPAGAGLSSSAALQCAVAVAIADLAGLDLDPTAVALLAKRSENEFVGVPTGVMDQMASMHGRAGRVVFLDVRSLTVERIALPLAHQGLALLVIDTGVPRALVDGQYAARRETCDSAARMLGVESLRDVSVPGLDAAMASLSDDLARHRVRHVVTENHRVLATADALRSGNDPRTIGPALTASHHSLRDDFEVTVPPLDIAVTSALGAGAHGARMTGGGFGGCVIALVESDDVERVTKAVAESFREAGFDAPRCFLAESSDGAGRLR